MSAGGENAGLAVGRPQTTPEGLSHRWGTAAAWAGGSHTHLFHTGLNLPILFHLCPVQVTRI